MSNLTYPHHSLPHHLRCPHTGAVMRPVLCSVCTADEVVVRYMTLKTAYYEGAPLVSDEYFDRFEGWCREEFPNDRRFYNVGS